MRNWHANTTRILILILHIFWIGGICTPAGFAQQSDDEGMMTTIGSSPLDAKNTTSTRQAAIDDALSAAVQKAILESAATNVLVEKFKEVGPLLAGDVSHFTLGYKVLAENPLGERYLVLVQTRVSRQAVEEFLADSGLSADIKPLPRILLCVAETALDDPEPIYWWSGTPGVRQPVAEARLATALTEQGFTLIDPAGELPGILKAAVSDRPYLSPSEAANLGDQFKADMVILGTAAVEQGQSSMGSTLKTFQATVNLQAIRTDTSEELAATSQTHIAAEADDIAGTAAAFDQSAGAAGDELASKIAAAWQQMDTATHTIEIMVAGTSNLKSFIALRRELTQTRGVQEMSIKELKADTAILNIAYTGEAQALAQELMLKPYEAFGIRIDEVIPGRINMALITGN
jgi:hypothetical protein